MPNDIKWIYDHPKWSLEVYAKNKEEAVATFRNYGIIDIDMSKLKVASESPQDIISDTELQDKYNPPPIYGIRTYVTNIHKRR